MKKTPLIIFTVILNTALLSCEPEKIMDDMTNESNIEETTSDECCGNGGEIPPPLP